MSLLFQPASCIGYCVRLEASQQIQNDAKVNNVWKLFILKDLTASLPR